jgi:hypothetical protein
VLVCNSGSMSEVNDGDDEMVRTSLHKPAIKMIYAHRQILAASSEVFQTMMYGPFVEGSKKEILIPNIQGSIMQMMVQFIYTG